MLAGIVFAISAVLMLLANYLVFIYAPVEQIMGAVQKIFYFHVGSAIASYCSFGIVFLCSLVYLSKRSAKADLISGAAGEVGFVWCTIVLISGMIWGHAAWNTWFNWEPRLVTFLLLWIIFLAFNLLRAFGDPQRIAVHAAVLGILGSLTVPAVVLSVNFLPQVAQLHPRLSFAEMPQSMKLAFGVSVLAVVLFQFVLVWLRAKIAILAFREVVSI